MADRLEHREIGHRVAVRVRVGEIDSVARGELVHGFGFVRTVRVERELARVPAVLVDVGARRDREVGAEVLGERFNHLGGRRRDDDHVTSRGVMLGEQLERFREDDRGHDLVERLAHDLRNVGLIPTAREPEHGLPQLLHLLLVGTDEHEDDLRVRALHDGAPREQPLPVERSAEREDRALRDDGLVEVEKGGLHARQVTQVLTPV